MKKIILLGGGRHCKVVIETLKEKGEYEIFKISDLPEKMNTPLLDYKITLLDKHLEKYYPKIKYAFISLGNDLKLRERLFYYALNIGFNFPILISPSAKISKYAKIGEGTLITKNAVINVDTTIGKNCIIYSSAVIEHDCCIGDHTYISPSAAMAGNVKIGNTVFIGINATIMPDVEIGNNSIIGAGSVILDNVPENVTVAGNPARIIKKVMNNYAD